MKFYKEKISDNNDFNQHRFKKSFGQNFLTKEIWPQKITKYLSPMPQVALVEIGPGHGILTNQLIKTGNEVHSIEIDNELIPYLQNKFSNSNNFHLINQDILQIDLESDFINKEYMVCGSLPYNISKKIILMFLKAKNPPQKMVFIIQKEVAEDYSSYAPKAKFLSVFSEIYSDVTYMDTIPARDFHPTPAVDGAIIQFSNIKAKFDYHENLVKFVKAGYLQPRKKLSANLSSQGYGKQNIESYLIDIGSNINARCSELTLNQWNELFQKIENKAK